MKTLPKLLLILVTSTPVFGQKSMADIDSILVDTSYRQLITYFAGINLYKKDETTLALPTLMATKDYSLRLADSALHLHKQRRVAINPFGADKYPLSYSVLYQDNLISLFAPGYFTCFGISDWQRNLPLERQLNTRLFKRHWLISGQLVGLSDGTYWQFTPKKGWQPYTKIIPFNNRPKLFEDAAYLVYNECKGEFGGQIFFFDKQTKKIHYTESTCAVWVRQTLAGYEVLSSIGHGMGSANKQLIKNPRTLPEWTGKPTTRAITVKDSGKPITLFSLYEIQLFGGLERQRQPLYLAHINGRTLLASLSGHTFKVVDALFNDGLYTHQPVTTNYNGVYLINLAFYGIGGYREVSCLLIKNNQVTLLDWHEHHPRY